jgi:hypothetical protein
MMPANEQITLSGEEVIDVIKEIELILVSLHQMGSFYAQKHHEGYDRDNREYEKETTDFIDKWKVTHRLAKVRRILSEKFDDTLGNDDMDDLERAMEGLRYWEKPGDNPENISEFTKRDC